MFQVERYLLIYKYNVIEIYTAFIWSIALKINEKNLNIWKYILKYLQICMSQVCEKFSFSFSLDL